MNSPVSLWIESGDATVLDEAPALLGRAVAGGTSSARYLGGLAVALTVRYQRGYDPAYGTGPSRAPADPLARPPRRDPTDLDEAIEAARGALAVMPADDPDRPWVVSTLAVALALRYERSGDLAELGEALALAGGAAGTRHPPVDAARGTLLAWAAHTHATRRAAGVPRPDLRGRDLSGRNVRDVDLGGVDLTGARLVGTDLTGANLAGARLVGARLDRARLVDTVLSGADLTDAWLIGADLIGAHLTAATLDRAVLARATVEPDALAAARIRRAAVSPGARLETPRCRHPDAPATVLAATDDLVATGHEDATIRLWDAATGMLLREHPFDWDWSPVKGFEFSDEATDWAEVAALTFSPDGGRLAGVSRQVCSDYSSGYIAEILMWNLGATGIGPAWNEEVHASGEAYVWVPRAVELTFSPDGRSLALGAHHPAGTGRGADRDLDVRDVADGDPRWSLATDTDEWRRCVVHSPDSRLVGAGCVDPVLGEYSVAVRHAATGAPVGRWSTGGEEALAMALAEPAGHVRAATRGRQRWSTWQWGPDTDNDGELWHRQGTLTAAAYSPDGRRLAVATSERVALLDALTGAEVWSLAVAAILGPPVWSVSGRAVTELLFAPDGRWLVAGTEQAVRVYDAATGTALPGTARAVTFVPDGFWAIHPDGSVHLHDATGTAVRDLNPHRTGATGWRVAGLRLLRPDDLDQTPAN